MLRTQLFFVKVLMLLGTAESSVLVEDSYCTKSSDSRSGVCKAPENCPRLERRGSAGRRKSRRYSCFTQKLVCCPFGGGRRASVLRPADNRRSHNERCSGGGGRAPDPSGGCCGREADVANRIVGGSATSLEQYPWMALLVYRDAAGRRLQLQCGGFLVSARYVLTAKHCVEGAQVGGARVSHVQLAEYDRRTRTDCVLTEGGGRDCVNSIEIEVEQVVAHPDRDLALVRLKEPAPYTDFIRPICLPSEDVTKSSAARDLKFLVAGWGITAERRASAVKQHVEVPYVPTDVCAKVLKSRKMKPEQDPICAGGEEGKDSCNGDSGGPLMHDAGDYYQAAGVVSFGARRCGKRGSPAVHVNVYRNRQWLIDNMRD